MVSYAREGGMGQGSFQTALGMAEGLFQRSPGAMKVHFIHSSGQCLLNAYCVLGTPLGGGNSAGKKMDKTSAFVGLRR